MRRSSIILRGLIAALLALAVCGSVVAAQTKTKNIIFITADGLRWEEVFRGASEELSSKEGGGVENEAAFKAKYWRDTPAERRKALLPFFWSVVAKNGQIYGNRDLSSASRVENPYWFSFPGYSEMLCGYVDKEVNSNDLKNNPNVSVLEWLHRKPAFKDKVTAFGSWDALSFILNRDRAGFCINNGLEPVTGKISDRQHLLNALKTETVDLKPGSPPDSIMFYSALEYFKQNKPRVIYIMLGWTDVAAHRGRYDEYLKAAKLYDDYVRKIWETAQSMPEYKGNTTLIMTTDHGRGEVGQKWRDHWAGVPGSEKTWMAFMGPDTPALGERQNVEEVTNSQFAATLAALLGEDYNAAQPKAGKVIKDVVKGK